MNIDAVITWVNGHDPNFLREKKKYTVKELGTFSKIECNGLLDTRFNNIEEVYFTIRLIRKNLSWIRTIYLVTNGQKPSFWNDDFSIKYKVKLITHEQIFKGYEFFLPVFNSRSIEAMLWNIPNISERFLYFNDDMFVTTKLSQKDFYHDFGIVARGGMRFKNRLIDKLYRFFIKNSASMGLVGYRKESLYYPSYMRYFSPAHVPHPIIRDEYRLALKENLESIIQYRFRNKDQCWPVGLFYNHMANQDKLYKTDYMDWAYISSDRQLEDYLVAEKRSRILCVQSIEEYTEKMIDRFVSYLEDACL